MHKLNTIIIAAIVLSISSCATQAPDLSKFPPIKIIGKYKDKPITVTVYPDGSQPTEIEFDGDLGAPIEIDLTKKD